MRLLIGVVALLVAGFSVWWLSDELNRERLIGSEGFVDHGSKFGVGIGMPITAAEQELSSRGLRRSEIDGRGICSDRVYPVESAVSVWEDRGWPRKATVCLEAVADKAASISWYFSWGPDF